jgi:16S rRNA (guanine(966)-N(2))-methyltransferase RsmD
MIRVITGSAKNKKLVAPEVEGFRAVQEIAKAAAFSIIGEKVVGSRCLDLFAGSGNLGIEALSRGAESCDFVEESTSGYDAISANLVNCGFVEKAVVVRKDAVKYVSSTEKTYDIIFCDPFYNTTSHVFLMKNIDKILKINGVLLFFHGENLDFERLIAGTDLQVVTTRKFGSSLFEVLQHQD